ncbi:protein FAM170A [Tupaia chinensis]|uniref:protein FAM170A n=1 Tax=Tupaia chinensis TaxID=246437 RepID=UPI0003C8C821|nr:protein FAM170A [Tupaia chinensis]
MKRRQKRKHLENEECRESSEKGGGLSKLQDGAPQPESTGVAGGWCLGVGEVSSASEYFSCVSSPRKLTHGGIRRLHGDSPQPRSPLAQGREGRETLLRPQPVPFSSRSSYKTCVSSLCIVREDKGMKIYYMQVQMRKGVAVSWETEASESLEKQPKMEEATLLEDLRAGTPPSDVSTRNLLSDSEPSGEEKEPEEKAEPDSPPGSPVAEERPRAKTPDWLVTMDSGFRCLACCRVFPTVDALREHVQYGVREGFSCHVFHLAMAQLLGSVEAESTQEEDDHHHEEEDDHHHEEEDDHHHEEADEKPESGDYTETVPSLGRP